MSRTSFNLVYRPSGISTSTGSAGQAERTSQARVGSSFTTRRFQPHGKYFPGSLSSAATRSRLRLLMLPTQMRQHSPRNSDRLLMPWLVLNLESYRTRTSNSSTRGQGALTLKNLCTRPTGGLSIRLACARRPEYHLMLSRTAPLLQGVRA